MARPGSVCDTRACAGLPWHQQGARCARRPDRQVARGRRHLSRRTARGLRPMRAAVWLSLGLLLLRCGPAVAPRPLVLSVVLRCLVSLGSNAPISGGASAAHGAAGIWPLASTRGRPAHDSAAWRGPGGTTYGAAGHGGVSMPRDIGHAELDGSGMQPRGVAHSRDWWEWDERPLQSTEEQGSLDQLVPPHQPIVRHAHRSCSEGAIPSAGKAEGPFTGGLRRGRPRGRKCPRFCQHVGCERVGGCVLSEPLLPPRALLPPQCHPAPGSARCCVRDMWAEHV